MTPKKSKHKGDSEVESNEPIVETANNLALPRFLSKRDVAKLLGYTVRTIDRLIARRRIPFVRIPTGIGMGVRIKFDRLELDKWLAECSQQVEPEETVSRGNLRKLAIGLISRD